MIRVGIIETGQPSRELIALHGDFPRMFINYFAEQLDLDFSIFSAFHDKFPPAENACDAWLITGSSVAVYEQHPWIPPLEAFVIKAAEKSIPTLGICFGHQLMAQAHGGRVVQSAGGRGIGVHRYGLTEAGKKFIPDMTAVNLMAAHQDQVVGSPPGATLLASSDFCPYAALAYGASGLSFQAHPEFTPAFERALIDGWQAKAPISQAINKAAMETLDKIQPDSRQLVPVLGRFLAGHPVL